MSRILPRSDDHGTRMPRWLVVLPALACAVLAGCTSGTSSPAAGGGTTPQSASSATPASQTSPAAPASSATPASPGRVGAPVAFDARKGTPLPAAASENTSIGGDQEGAPPVALDGSTAFVTTGTSVQVVNTTTGQVTGTVRPGHPVPDPAGQSAGFVGSAAAPPLIADVAGGPAALAGYVVRLAGHGTTPPSLAVEIDAVTAAGRLAWDIVAPLPGQPGQAPFLSGNPDVAFVGRSGSTVVAAVGDSNDGYSTLAVDIAARKPLWHSQSFLASAVVGTTVVGTTDTSAPVALGTHELGLGDRLHLAGVSVARGTAEWQRPEVISEANVQQAGPGQVMVEAVGYLSGNDVISVLNAATGKGKTLASQREQAGIALPWTCRYGGSAVVVCDNGGGTQSSADFAVDGATGKTLWQLPDPKANRTALTVTAVYDGEVYGTTASGPVVLNARTGKDVNDSPGVAPVAVDPDVGIALSPSGGRLESFPASGGT